MPGSQKDSGHFFIPKQVSGNFSRQILIEIFLRHLKTWQDQYPLTGVLINQE